MDGRKLQEGNLVDPGRRRFSAGLCLGVLTTLAGCGGAALNEGADTTAAGSASDPVRSVPAPATAKVAKWDVVPTHALTLAQGGTFDLAATLPPNVPSGGTFEVDPSGASLPSGITLTPNGRLTVADGATGNAAGVVFRYIPPA